MGQAESTAISEPMKALLGLFDTEFAEVNFPDVDAKVLAEAARNVISAAERVAEAQAALQLAETELVEQQDALLHKGQRALAYARVFAEDSPELMEKLQLISLPRSLRRAKAEPASPGADVIPVRRRGRPPKPKNEAPNLFEEEMPVELGSTG